MEQRARSDPRPGGDPAGAGRPTGPAPARDPSDAVVVMVSWTVVGALLVRQQVEIGRARERRRGARPRSCGARLDDADRSADAIEAELDGAFDAAAVVASASPSVFTVFAGRIQGSAFVLDSATRSGRTLVTNFHVDRAVRGAPAAVGGRARRRIGRTTPTSAACSPSIDIALIEVPAQLPVLATDRWGLEVGRPGRGARVAVRLGRHAPPAGSSRRSVAGTCSSRRR